MPMPSPQKGEKEDAFMHRCMGDMQKEFPKHEQRVAVCLRQWRSGRRRGSSKAEAAAHHERDGWSPPWGS